MHQDRSPSRVSLEIIKVLDLVTRATGRGTNIPALAHPREHMESSPRRPFADSEATSGTTGSTAQAGT